MAFKDDDLFSDLTDPSARATIAEQYDRLAQRLARRFAGRGEPYDDLVQVARLGLVNAMNRFDTDRGVTFGTFATRTMVGELKRHLRDKAWAVRVPRGLQERSLEVNRAVQDLSQHLGRSPTLREIAGSVGAEVEEVIEALDAAGAYTAGSIDGPADGAQSRRAVGDTLGGRDPHIEMAADRLTAAEMIDDLAPRERTILYQRFFEGRTQGEIAERLGISQMHVSRLLRASLAGLRTRVTEE